MELSKLEIQAIVQETEDSLKLLRSVAKTDKEGNLIVNPDDYKARLTQHLMKQLEENPFASNDMVSKYRHCGKRNKDQIVLTRS